jgi:DNA repair photolyase
MKSFTSKHTGKVQSNPTSNDADNSLPQGKLKIKTVQGKPVIMRPNARTVLNLKSWKFAEKLLCDAITLNPGDACVFRCAFCYVALQVIKYVKRFLEALNAERRSRGESELGFEDVVIRRPDPVGLLRKQLFHRNGRAKFADPADTRVVYGSTLVDVAATMELLQETAALCNLILDHTAWQIRLLSKSSLLARLFKDNLIPARHRHRMILGFSTGTLDDNVAAAIEVGTAKVSKRIEALHWLQDEGYRTFGMICPSLPQADGDYVRFSREICEAIRVDRCEHIWAEVINLRGKSLVSTLAGLHGAGFVDQAEALSAVMGPGKKAAWEKYARDTFLAHTMHVPAQKLRFLQYVDDTTVDWWAGQRTNGAVLLGKVAEHEGLIHVIG